MGRSITKSNNILRRVLLLSLFVFLVLIFLIFKNISLSDLIQKVNIFWFLMLFLNMFIVILLNGVKFKLLVNSVGDDIPYKDALKIVLSSVFASNITPYYSGGIVAQIYLLKRFKNGVHYATLISVMYTILTVVVALIFATILLILPHPFLKSIRGTFIFSIIALAFLLSSFALFLMVNPTQTKRLVSFLVEKLSLKADLSKINLEIDAFSEGLKFILKNKRYLVNLILVNLVSQFLHEIIGLTSLKAIGIKFNFYEALITQIASSFVATIGITPGGMGVAEGTYLLLFIPIALKYAPLQTFLFRMFSYYIPSILGAIIFYKTLGTFDGEILKDANLLRD